jgi:hypothetical protein
MNGGENYLATPRLLEARACAPSVRAATQLGEARAAGAPARLGHAERDQRARTVEPPGLGQPVVRVRESGIARPWLRTLGREFAHNIGRASLLCVEDLPIFKSEADRFLRRGNAVANAEFPEDCRHVVIHGFRRYDQAVGDIDVAEALAK